MSKTTKTPTTNIFPLMLKAAGIAIGLFLIVNVLGFLYLLFQQGWSESSSFGFKWGSFYLNEETTGPVWGSSTATFLLFATFCFFLYRLVEKQRAMGNEQ